MIPVSYTHLDVYKRQIFPFSPRVSPTIWMFKGRVAPVLYISRPHDTVQDVIDILTQCNEVGLENMYVLDRDPRETVYYDAQWGAEYPSQSVEFPDI